MPDAISVANSRDVVQILFYFICALGLGIALSVAWFAKYILLPMRDRHFQYLDHQEKFMDQVTSDNNLRSEMHKDNLKKLSELHRLAMEIKEKTDKISCPAGPAG